MTWTFLRRALVGVLAGLALVASACAKAQDPLDQPMPDPATDEDSLVRVANELSREGGNQSDRATFIRWAKRAVLRIMANGGKAIEMPATVGDAIEDQRRVEANEEKEQEEGSVRWARSACANMKASGDPEALLRIVYRDGFSIGDQVYSDPCEALRANGLEE